MKAKIRDFLKKDFLINQLMRLYSALLIVVILLLLIGVSLYTSYESYRSSWQAKETTAIQLEKIVSDKNTAVNNLQTEFYLSDQKYESMRNYLIMSPPAYFDYRMAILNNGGADVYFPTVLNRSFMLYPDLKEIVILLDEEDQIYLQGDRKNNLGLFTPLPYKPKKERFTIFRPINNPDTFDKQGELYITFETEGLLGETSLMNHKKGIDSFVFAANGELLFSDDESISVTDRKLLIGNFADFNEFTTTKLSQKYYVETIKGRGNETIVVLLSKNVLWGRIIQRVFWINFSGWIILAFLLIVLQKTFKRYSYQVGRIVEVTQKIGQGDFNEAIDTNEVQQELKDLAEAINQMVISINQYIDDVYMLEVKQRDAHMRALQSQINPHFLYNTLEYIRMYAFSQEQEELADVVYAFSALLRNNTTQEKSASLETELDFCEKYVYLYQMRYPDKIAYHVSIDSALKGLNLPKFAIQPLVENYFVHGIDYTRTDNAISIKAYRENGKIVIQVIDNGKGVGAEQLDEIQRRLAIEGMELDSSIGIKNVDERLRGYFGSNYQMLVFSSPGEGFKIQIVLAEEVLTYETT